ncbi:MAG: hypothetical protein JJU28_03170 [Cyclobacteriaceae bacterium]|nr:hypothetical protein [Cyclobacteriaceae bacterium]
MQGRTGKLFLNTPVPTCDFCGVPEGWEVKRALFFERHPYFQWGNLFRFIGIATGLEVNRLTRDGLKGSKPYR